MSFMRGADDDTPDSSERLGKPSEPRPEGCLLWMVSDKAADAGSVLAICQALSLVREEPVHCLLSTTSDAPPVPSVAKGVIHQLSPVETQGSISRFLNHWSPDVGVFLGDIDAPKLAAAAAARNVPLFHAGLTRNTHRKASYLKDFKACLATSAADARDLRRELNGKGVEIRITGPLTDTVHALPCNEAECDDLGKLLGGRPVWLAAMLALGELDEVEIAHRRAFRAAHRMLLIIVPQDLSEAPKMQQKLEAAGWSTALRSVGHEPDPDVQIYIADTEEELGLWYRLAPISFVGGTFSEGGASADPFDPAALGSAVLHGPELGVAAPRFRRLAAAGGCLDVTDGESLGGAVETLLAPDKAAALAQAGWAVTTESAPVVDELVELLDIALEGA